MPGSVACWERLYWNRAQLHGLQLCACRTAPRRRGEMCATRKTVCTWAANMIILSCGSLRTPALPRAANCSNTCSYAVGARGCSRHHCTQGEFGAARSPVWLGGGFRARLRRRVYAAWLLPRDHPSESIVGMIVGYATQNY